MSWSGIPYAIEAILGERKKRDEIRDKAMKKLRASTKGDRTMTEIEKKALALVNEVQEFDCCVSTIYHVHNGKLLRQALCRAIERHEADKAAHAATIEGILKAHEAYKQEVSDAVVEYFGPKYLDIILAGYLLERFIISKPDPLADAWIEATGNTVGMGPLNEALAKRGLKIVEIER